MESAAMETSAPPPSVAWDDALSSSSGEDDDDRDGQRCVAQHTRSQSVPPGARALAALRPDPARFSPPPPSSSGGSSSSSDSDGSVSPGAAPRALQLSPFAAARHRDVAAMSLDALDGFGAGAPRAPERAMCEAVLGGARVRRVDSDLGDLVEFPRRPGAAPRLSGELFGGSGAGYARLRAGDDDGGAGGSLSDLGAGGGGGGAKGKTSTASAVSRLKKGWKAVKRTSMKSTASAGKALSNLSSDYLKPAPPVARQPSAQASADREEWLTSILPSWPRKRRAARTRMLLFRGVPSSVRGVVWRTALGNPLNVSDELFAILKEKGRAGRAQYMRGKRALEGADGDVGGAGGRAEALMEHERSAHKAILLDLPRTFPGLAFFHADGSQYETALRDMLEAFVYLRPDVGYSQGMSFLGAVLLLFMEPGDAFACFVTMLLYKSCFLQFFRIQMPDVRIYLNVHQRLLAEEMPALSAHFAALHVEADLYMINWVMSLYCRALPLDLVSRIWDIYVVDGDVAIFRAALGILKFLQPRLLDMNFEDIAYMLSHLPVDEMSENAIMQSIRSVRSVTHKKFKHVFRECERDYAEENKPGAAEHVAGAPAK